MPVYSYVASDNDGRTVKGKISATNELDLEDRISELGLVLLSNKAINAKGGSVFGKVTTKDLIMLCIHMEQLDRAGVPLLDALADLRDSADNASFRDLIAEIYENVKGGEILSAAMKKRGDVFNEVFVGLIQAGEKTGRMAECFEHLATHFKWHNDLRRSIKKATTYPAVLIVVMSAVVSVMMLFVVPKLVDFLTNQGFDLPIHTRALIATSNFFVHYWYLIFIVPIFSTIGVIIGRRVSESFRFKTDKLILKFPFIGQVVLKINLARFSHFFAVTFSSGIGVLECLETAQGVTGNLVIRDAIAQITQNVSEGNSLTRSISATGQFPSLVVRMFKVGEDSGNMDDALKNINFFYDREVEDAVRGMIDIIQPALTIVMGGIMFWVTAAVFGPLYQSFSKLNI